MTIDIACHWLHLHTSLLQVYNSFHEFLADLFKTYFEQGATSHKFVDPTGNYWMRLYYTDRQFSALIIFHFSIVNEQESALLHVRRK